MSKNLFSHGSYDLTRILQTLKGEMFFSLCIIVEHPEDTLPEQNNTEVYFLPPNPTSKIQTMDAGIIAEMKGRYWKMQMENASGKVDAGAKNIGKVDALTAMEHVKEVWIVQPPNVISNCWRHTGILNEKLTPSKSSTGSNIGDAGSSDNVLEEISGLVASIVPTNERMNISNFLNREIEDIAMQQSNVEEIIQSVLPE